MTLRATPFLVMTGLYFFAIHIYNNSLDHPEETLFNACVKILPILALIFLAFSTNPKTAAHADYRQNIIMGLFFSTLGDICLVWRFSLFEAGAIFFAIAHIWYIRAMGFKSLRLDILLLLIIPALILNYFQMDGIKGPVLFQGICYTYMLTIFVMAWRASARLFTETNLGFIFAFIGALFFVVSDNILAYDMMISPFPQASVLIMITYYMAQFGFALSVAYYSDAPINHSKIK